MVTLLKQAIKKHEMGITRFAEARQFLHTFKTGHRARHSFSKSVAQGLIRGEIGQTVKITQLLCEHADVSHLLNV